MSVTTTSLRQGKFETRFWHKVFEEEVGRVKGHFGPINTYVFPPNFVHIPFPLTCFFMNLGLQCIPPANAMLLVERMVSCVCTTSTILI